MPDLLESGQRLSCDALRRRIGSDELRVFSFYHGELMLQRVQGLFRDLLFIEHVVVIPMLLDRLAKLGEAFDHVFWGYRAILLHGHRIAYSKPFLSYFKESER